MSAINEADRLTYCDYQCWWWLVGLFEKLFFNLCSSSDRGAGTV